MATHESTVRMARITFFCLAVGLPDVVRAQDARVRVSFEPAVATVSGDAALALGGSAGYRFSDHFWFEGGLTWIDAAAGGFRHRDFHVDGFAPIVADVLQNPSMLFGNGRFPILPNLPDLPVGRLDGTTDGSTFVGTMGVRYELPAETARFRPYLAGGVGIDHTDQHIMISAPTLTPAINRSTSQTGLALSGGGGASIRVTGHVWADMDATYFHLSQDRNVMRLGGGASFRF